MPKKISSHLTVSTCMRKRKDELIRLCKKNGLKVKSNDTKERMCNRLRRFWAKSSKPVAKKQTVKVSSSPKKKSSSHGHMKRHVLMSKKAQKETTRLLKKLKRSKDHRFRPLPKTPFSSKNLPFPKAPVRSTTNTSRLPPAPVRPNLSPAPKYHRSRPSLPPLPKRHLSGGEYGKHGKWVAF